MEVSYQDFISSKINKFSEVGFDCENLNASLKDFQRFCVQKALKKGKFALFEDCGLGKTLQQLAWAEAVYNHTGKKVLILAPLAVVQQTIREANKFNINTESFDITNYEQIDNYPTDYSGIVLDESSILKGRDGKLSGKIIERFNHIDYKLACTATPSPNDHMELGQHAEFLGVMKYTEMLSMYFVHDGGQTSKWRLRKHAEKDFWDFVSTWSISVDNPKTLGFNSDGYELPEINYIEHLVQVNRNDEVLFDTAVSATDLHRDLKASLDKRIEIAKQIVKGGKWIVWCLQNREAEIISKELNAVNVQGSDKPEYKAKMLNAFANGEIDILVTKPSIAGFGMNFQNTHNQLWMSFDFGFEKFYQAVRRQYRFGQSESVNVHLIIPSTQQNVRQSILKKQSQHQERIKKMSIHSANHEVKDVNRINDVKTDDYWLMNGDCVSEIQKVETESVHLQVFSPPFAELYVYSDKPEDMGNVRNYNEFENHFKYLIPELYRTLKSGRICAIHCMDLPIQKGKEGFIGLRDFSGMIVKWFTDQGFIYHARTTIWKNPVTEMQRTKALGLLHKTIKKDSSMSRVGIPDYILFFRKDGENKEPITHQDTDPSKPDYLPVDLWQKYASPVWYDIEYNRTLQYTTARGANDEKHICPLQLDTIERIMHLYSNEGETVLSPFGGIGSEGFQALKMGRKSISIELKESYFKVNHQNHKAAIESNKALTLF